MGICEVAFDFLFLKIFIWFLGRVKGRVDNSHADSSYRSSVHFVNKLAVVGNYVASVQWHPYLTHLYCGILSTQAPIGALH